MYRTAVLRALLRRASTRASAPPSSPAAPRALASPPTRFGGGAVRAAGSINSSMEEIARREKINMERIDLTEKKADTPTQKRIQQVNLKAELLSRRFWFSHDKINAGLMAWAEWEIHNYRSYYARHGVAKAEDRELYEAEERLYNLWQASYTVHMLCFGMLTTRNDLLHESGWFGTDMGEVTSMRHLEVMEYADAMDEYLRTLPEQSELYQKCRRELMVVYAAMKALVRRNDFAFRAGTIAGGHLIPRSSYG